MKRKFLPIIIFIILGFFELVQSKVLVRNTFEDFEGSISAADWTTSIGNDGIVIKDLESPVADSFQFQAHGKFSMRVEDPNNTSYAFAYKDFSNTCSEYMTEFYF